MKAGLYGSLWLLALLPLLGVPPAHAQDGGQSVPSIDELQKQLDQKKAERASHHAARPPAAPRQAAPRPPADDRPSFRDCPDCPEMIHVAAGSFVMGSPADEPSRDKSEGPQHSVAVPAFYIGKYDVTFDEWDACVAAGACSRHADDKGWGRGRHPVIDVSWEDLQPFLKWLSSKAGHTYRLPSEAEWEYAARAGTTTAYWWGEDLGTSHTACNGCGSEWDGKGTAPVGSFPPNPWDLYDMLGNVWQWTADCWHDDYDGAPADGSAWVGKGKSWLGGGCGRRVARGGSKDDKPRNVRAAARASIRAGSRDNFRGFRVARSESEAP